MTFSYDPRPIVSLGTWEVARFRLKVYGITLGSEKPSQDLIGAAGTWVWDELTQRPTRQKHYGAGFVGIHEGRGENQVFLDIWINENELLHRYVVSSKETPTALYPPTIDHNSVCIWDLWVQCQERDAWITNVLLGGDVDAYLEDFRPGVA